MKKEQRDRRAEAFRLFDEGKTKKSPEVKALGLKYSTIDNYYLKWQKERNPDSPVDASGKTRVISESQMVIPPSLEQEESEPVDDESEAESDESEPENEDKEDKGRTSVNAKGDGKRPPPTMVAGQGLTFSITISTKTLMLYQFAASQLGKELTLGDFIDVCVEDAYLGRGLDLGLVKIGGEEENG